MSKQILVNNTDTNVFIQALEGLVTHVECRGETELKRVELTGWMKNGKVQITFGPMQMAYINLQKVLK